MNPKVEEFIKKMKEEEQRKTDAKKEILLKEREAHLISLGLIDETKSRDNIEYLKEHDGTHNCKYDPEIEMYCKKTRINVPIEVTDEEYLEILKYAPIKETEQSTPKKSFYQAIKNPSEIMWGEVLRKFTKVVSLFNVIIGLLGLITFSIFFISYGEDITYKQEEMFIELIGVSMCTIIYTSIAYIFIMGWSKIVTAAEKYLKK